MTFHVLLARGPMRFDRRLSHACTLLALVVGLAAAETQAYDTERSLQNVRKPKEQWGLVALTQGDERLTEVTSAVHTIEALMRTFPSWAALHREYAFPVIDHESLAALYVSRFTRNPTPLNDQELAELPALLDDAMADVAHERYAKARAHLEKIRERTSRALETINRDQRLATQVLDACLYDVRIELKTSGRQAAILRALRCRQDVPDAPPSDDTHPDDVLSVLRQAEMTLNVAPKSELSIDSVPRKNCDVYLNGRLAGKTPYSIRDATQRRYLVQVECDKGALARIHEVELKAQPMRVVLDTDLESALHTRESGIRLTYPQPLPMVFFSRAQQHGTAPSKVSPVAVRDTPEGLFHERVVRHLKAVRTQLGVTHLVAVYFFGPKDLAIHVYGPPGPDGELSQISGHLPWDGFGEPRKECARTPERWAWVKVLVSQWLAGAGLGVFSNVDETARARERERCGLSASAGSARPARAPGREGQR